MKSISKQLNGLNSAVAISGSAVKTQSSLTDDKQASQVHSGRILYPQSFFEAQGLSAEEVAAELAKQEADSAREELLNPHASKSHPLPPGYQIKDGWLWYADPSANTTKEVQVCTELRVIALTRDAQQENHGKLLEFKDPDGHIHRWAMPLDILATDGADCRRELQRLGLTVRQGKARILLTDYLMLCKPRARLRCVNKTGWHGSNYVLPGEIIDGGDELLLLQTETAEENRSNAQLGSLEGWRQNISSLCVKNSRLVFAVSTAFAPVLLRLVDGESALGMGFHLGGASSSGKTTVLNVAASCWGGAEHIRQWRTTSNGLEGVAVAHNDALLCLDELGQLADKDAGDAVYLLSNGIGKTRANKRGKARPIEHWRLIYLSTGELNISDKIISGGDRVMAGHEVRMIYIPADASCGLGVFESLHDKTSGHELADHLAQAVQAHHGHAAAAFIEHAVHEQDNISEAVRDSRTSFREQYVPSGASGEVYRVADAFALVAAAGELASRWEITGWPEGEATKGAARCFKDWLKDRGTSGNLEQQQILSHVKAILEAWGESRFSPTTGNVDRHNSNRLGYRQPHKDGGAFLVLPEQFRLEFCNGHNQKLVAEVLLKAGHLITEDGRYQHRVTVPAFGGRSRFYVISPSILGIEEC